MSLELPPEHPAGPGPSPEPGLGPGPPRAALLPASRMYSRGNPLDRVSAEALLDCSVALESACCSLQQRVVQLKKD